jgi:2-oxoglutarate ferredoxin oxidoreductase subunit alpha
MVGQADMMQARWGSHGDYEPIALCPQSPQETFELTIDAFNLAETYRVPVLVMMDECVGHMTEKVVIPPPEEIEIVARELTKASPEEFLPYKVNGDQIPEFARAGDGYRFHTTGLTHDERGYPAMTVDCQKTLVHRLMAKINDNVDKIVRFDEEDTDGADVVVVSYGITARVARMGIQMAREKGVKVGVLRLIVVWPFPEQRIRDLSAKIKAFVIPEINYGQMSLEVERCAAGKCAATCVPHAGGGVHEPADICEAILRAAK